MRRSLVELSGGAAFVVLAALGAGTAGAQQDTTRRPATGVTRVARAGDVATSSAVRAVSDSAIERLEDFLQEYPNSPLRPNGLFQVAELLVRRADERFAQQQRVNTSDSSAAATPGASAEAPIRADYGPAITRLEELVRRYPTFERIDAAAYTLGTLYASNQRWADAARMFERVTAIDSSRYAPEAYFRLGDAHFELASRERGEPRRALFGRAATAYERAAQRAPQQGDIHFLALYKLGWAYYNQATQTNTASYEQAVQTFGRLVEDYDKLSPEQQARLGLKGEAIEYMAVAFTQVGGAEAAQRYFSQPGRGQYRVTVLSRVAESLRDQGDFTRAVEAYEALLKEAPNDTSALAAQQEIVDIYQNRMIEPERAQQARLALVERFAPGSAWAQANPGQVQAATQAREQALRQSGQYLLAGAQTSRDRARYQQAAQLYERYLTEFQASDSAQSVATYLGESYFGQGDYMRAGAAYSRAAYGFANRPSTPASADSTRRDTTAARGRAAAPPTNLAEQAGRNAIVAFDSALVNAKADRAAQDSLFTSVDKFAQTFPQSPTAKTALILKGRRASETQRWDEMAQAFRRYATTYPNDAYTPTAQKLVGDALYRGGSYAEAQVQWEQAQTVAAGSGRRALADSIAATRSTAASLFADTLIRRGEYRRAAEEVYVAIADKNPQGPRAPDALRDAIETYMIVIDSARQKNQTEEQVQQARARAIELSSRLVQQYPSYRYRTQYQNLNARLLAESGRRDEAITALRALASDPRNPERNAVRARLAVTLDSAGQKREAAQEYEALSRQTTGQQAQDALWNAALTYREAGDTAQASRTFASFIQRYPSTDRAREARAQRYNLLLASGDTTAAQAELRVFCRNPRTDEERAQCSGERARVSAGEARAAFDRGRALYQQYDELTLRITSKAQLTQRGVATASARKQALLRQLSAAFRQAIETGNAEYLAASTYYIGLAQWEYGRFVENVELPSGLTDAEQEAAKTGSSRQAEQYYNAARQAWRALVQKADQDPQLKNDERARRWVDRARQGIEGDVPNDAPSASRRIIDDEDGRAARVAVVEAR
jgi:TolA-binding protein